jgi:AcrR family transcriptional regulator
MTISATVSDPRVQRTRNHVITCALGIISSGEELTFASLATRARVSRKTLYAHFDSFTGLLAELIRDVSFTGFHTEGLADRARIVQVVGELSVHLEGPTSAIGTMLIAAAFHDAEARRLLDDLDAGMHALLEEAGLPMTDVEYQVVVGSLVYYAITRGGPTPAALITQLIDYLDRR